MSETLFAPAKINLWLRIFPPDSTAYHPLDTLFCATDLADEVTVDRSNDDVHVDVVGADLGNAHDNLALRAARAFFHATGIPARAAIRLHKRIPAGAGLGGGSSDAAAVLRGLNQLHHEVLSIDELLAIGARLGSDVPFFLCGAALAHGTGRGEVLRMLPSLPSLPVLVVAPDFAISTADAYRWLDEAGVYSNPANRIDERPYDWAAVARQACNAFEPVILRKYETLAHIKATLLEAGAMIALLSGSGSTVFGIYARADERERAVSRLRKIMPQASLHITATAS